MCLDSLSEGQLHVDFTLNYIPCDILTLYEARKGVSDGTNTRFTCVYIDTELDFSDGLAEGDRQVHTEGRNRG